jgi:hypothetical protein
VVIKLTEENKWKAEDSGIEFPHNDRLGESSFLDCHF